MLQPTLVAPSQKLTSAIAQREKNNASHPHGQLTIPAHAFLAGYFNYRSFFWLVGLKDSLGTPGPLAGDAALILQET